MSNFLTGGIFIFFSSCCWSLGCLFLEVKCGDEDEDEEEKLRLKSEWYLRLQEHKGRETGQVTKTSINTSRSTRVQFSLQFPFSSFFTFMVFKSLPVCESQFLKKSRKKSELGFCDFSFESRCTVRVDEQLGWERKRSRDVCCGGSGSRLFNKTQKIQILTSVTENPFITTQTGSHFLYLKPVFYVNMKSDRWDWNVLIERFTSRTFGKFKKE